MWWRKSYPKHLPFALGSYTPGCIDVMNSYSSDSTFIRLYYPTAHTKNENSPEHWFNWSPDDRYVEDLSNIVVRWSTPFKILVWLYGGVPQVPAMWESQPIKSEKKLPVIIFSHGFSATRFFYSSIAIDLASRGFVVASIEHKDKSACATYYYESAEHLERNEKTWITHEKMEFGPAHYAIRNKQLHKRYGEVIRLIDFLEEINNGEATNIVNSKVDINSFKDCLDLSSICAMGHSFGGATTLMTIAHDDRIALLKSFTSKMLIFFGKGKKETFGSKPYHGDYVAISGSYSSSLVFYQMFYKCGVILDGWMFPLKDEKNLVFKKPLLFINTQTFHIESNLRVIERILKECQGSAKEIYTIKHTTHESQTDSPLIMGYWLDWFMPKLDPIIGTLINNHMILRFFNKCLGFPEDTSESDTYLKENEHNIVEGTFLYRNIPQRKL